MQQADYRVVTVAQNRELVTHTQKRIGPEWPEFMLHDPVADLLADCYTYLPDFQFVLVHGNEAEPVAIANSIPLDWSESINDLPDDGWDWALTKGVDDLRSRRQTNILCALQVVVFGEHRGRHISSEAVRAMKQIGAAAGLAGMIAPVRPNRKAEYPRMSIREYITRKDDRGMPFDPWLRVHYHLGARIVKPCPRSMRITGTVAEWEDWTEMSFSESGDYEVPGALVPVNIDRDKDLGCYVEPNVWMHHPPEPTGIYEGDDG